MKLDRIGIERVVPQTGRMCLLESVDDWSASHIVCSAAFPDAAHPLAQRGSVAVVAAIEYAAQATAVHGALVDNAATFKSGMLAKLMNVELHGDCLPTGIGHLRIEAGLISASEAGGLYTFSVGSAAGPLAAGRLMVVLT